MSNIGRCHTAAGGNAEPWVGFPSSDSPLRPSKTDLKKETKIVTKNNEQYSSLKNSASRYSVALTLNIQTCFHFFLFFFFNSDIRLCIPLMNVIANRPNVICGLWTHRFVLEVFYGWNALLFADTARVTVIKQDGHATVICI